MTDINVAELWDISNAANKAKDDEIAAARARDQEELGAEARKRADNVLAKLQETLKSVATSGSYSHEVYSYSRGKNYPNPAPRYAPMALALLESDLRAQGFKTDVAVYEDTRDGDLYDEHISLVICWHPNAK